MNKLKALLGFDPKTTTVKTELIAGMTTFLTMCYILAAGALLGSSNITTYVESASGVAEGGKSGLTSFFVGLMFILSIFLAPIFLLIPSAATSGALVMVGVLMIDSFKKIELEDISESFPAFITMITIVLCYSIADGICLGILSYVLIKMMVGKFKDLNPTLYILSIFLLFNYVFG